MSDEAHKSDLAELALAQKAERDRLAEEAAKQRRAAEVRAEDVAGRWKHISGRILETCRNINSELKGTETTLVENKEPDVSSGGVVGGYQITVTRDGTDTPSQKIYLRMSKAGALNTYSHFGLGKAVKEQHFSFEDLDNAGIDALIRAFVREALT